MLQDAITSKVDKATTVVIDIMTTTRTTTAPAVNPMDDAPVDDAPVSFFDQFSSNEDSVEKSRDDIVAELVKKPSVKKVTGLHIRNVVTNTSKDIPFLTFVLREWIIGDTRGASTDAFGVPEIVLGRTHNAVVSAYAVSAVMKDSPKTAMFAQRVAEGADVANVLFAGGTMDILMEYVAAGEEYVNPFAAIGTHTVFERDHVLIHVIGITMGEVGRDAYAAMLSRI